jgi:hypothetical protein
VKNTKRSVVLGTVLSLSLVVIIAVSAFALALAANPTDSLVKRYGTEGQVVLQLPSNATPPAPPGTNSSHPTTLILTAIDADGRSTNGASDLLIVWLWKPVGNLFEPVASITDNANDAEFAKTLWNGSYVWYPVGPPLFPVKTNLSPNVIKVGDKDLEVWTETASIHSGNGHWRGDENGRCVWTSSEGTLMVNLTKAVTITLPYYNASGTRSNQTFILPPTTLMFRGLGNDFKEELSALLTGYPNSSNYTIVESKMTAPAWVRVSVPDWLGRNPFEVTGNIGWRLTQTFIPPS